MTKAKGAPKKTVLFGIGAAIILLLLTLVIYQVDSTEYAVVTQFGQPVRVVEDAGLKIKLPDPIQSVQRLDKRVQVYQTSSIELLTLDRLNVSLDYYGTWKIVDPILFLQTVRDNIGAEARLLDVFSSSLSVQLGQYKLEQLVNTDAEKLLKMLEKEGGRLPFNDKADPEFIREATGMSKNEFKRAVGNLYKQRLILIESDGIRRV